MKWSKVLDQLKRGFNTLQRGLRIGLSTSDPNTIDHAAFREPQRKLVSQRGSCHWRVARHGPASLPTTLAYPKLIRGLHFGGLKDLTQMYRLFGPCPPWVKRGCGRLVDGAAGVSLASEIPPQFRDLRFVPIPD